MPSKDHRSECLRLLIFCQLKDICYHLYNVDEVTATASLSPQSSASLGDASVVYVDSAASEPKTGKGYLDNEWLFEVDKKKS